MQLAFGEALLLVENTKAKYACDKLAKALKEHDAIIKSYSVHPLEAVGDDYRCLVYFMYDLETKGIETRVLDAFRKATNNLENQMVFFSKPAVDVKTGEEIKYDNIPENKDK